MVQRLRVEGEVRDRAADEVKAKSEDRDFTAAMRFNSNRSKLVLPVTDFERPEEGKADNSDEDA